MTRSHLPFRHMRQFKAVAADWEYFTSLSDEGRLYCLTDQQVYILLVQCEYIGWLTRWYNTEDIAQPVVQLVQSEVMAKLMSCVDIQVLIDQAKLNLVDSVTSNQIQAQELRDILEDRYIDGDPTSINPSAPTTDFGSTGDRYDALCAGLMAFVYGFARAQSDSARAAEIGGLLAVAAIAALLIPGLNFFFVVGASIAVLLGLGTIGVSLETAIAALTDTTALDAVVCYMRETLKADSVTEANWNACLDAYPFAVGSHEAIICDFIKPTLPQNYLTILNILGQAYDGTINGDAMPACPCDPVIVPNIEFGPSVGLLEFDGSPRVFIENTITGGSVWDLTFHTALGATAVAVTASAGGGSSCVYILDVDGDISYQHDLCAGGSDAGAVENPTVLYGPDLGWFGPSDGAVMRVHVEPDI